MDPTSLYMALLLSGLLLIGAEIFVPGGILGLIGGGCLLSAALVGFNAFGPRGGMIAAMLVLILLGASIVLWIKWIPDSRMGRSLTLANDTGSYKSTTLSYKELEGREGEALTPLGPSGLVRIDGRRLDAMADGRWIDAGARIRVVRVSGNQITVRKVEEPTVVESDAA
jgi:membrane-bound serine protease (ClpP class)